MPRLSPAFIHFVTDTEGHHASFVNSVKHSQVVCFDATGRLDFQRDRKNPYFIFGGDLTDRAPGDIPLTEMLLDFKKRFMDRVFLLVGNREASKARFFVELNPKHIRQRLLKGGAPFWLLSGHYKVPLDYVKKDMDIHCRSSEDVAQIELYVESLSVEQCQLIYLKWMLEQNLGCQHTLFYQTQYLAEQLECRVEDVSEVAVLNSILQKNAPNGLMGEYLRHTQIAAIIPETGVLAVHGGFTSQNIGRLPTMPKGASRMEDVHVWIHQFNQWYRTEVLKWSQLTHDDLPLVLEPARSTLDTFSMRVPSEYRSIVTSSMLNTNRQFVDVPEEVSDYLSQAGINCVVTGHQPCGDHPVLLRTKDDKLVFINGDIGYANSKANDVHDTRGLSFHTTQIEVDGNHTKITIDASLCTGERLQSTLELLQGKVVDNTYIGKILPNHELVQCRLPNGYYRTMTQNGFKVEYKFRLEDELRCHFLDKRDFLG